MPLEFDPNIQAPADTHNPKELIAPDVRYGEALGVLEAELHKLFGCDDEIVTVDAWCNPRDGLRVAGVNILRADRRGGGSFMRTVPENMALILACEQYMEAWGYEPWRPSGWTSDVDEFADAKWRLEAVIRTYHPVEVEQEPGPNDQYLCACKDDHPPEGHGRYVLTTRQVFTLEEAKKHQGPTAPSRVPIIIECPRPLLLFRQEDFIWHCPQCRDEAFADYDVILEVGYPQCGNCDCDMERGRAPNDNTS